MEQGIRDKAGITIGRPKYIDELRYKDGVTGDIISEILAVDKISKNDTAKFAHNLRGKTDYDTLRNVWSFIKLNIRYIIDPYGKQFIKTPARIWSDHFADCKGYSIFIASLLKNLGFNFSYRFVSYTDTPVYTHVYIVCNNVILDAVMPEFDKEKPYKLKKDIQMTQVIRMSGFDNESPSVSRKVINLGNRDIADMSEGELDLWIARDRFLTEKKIVENIQGIGSLKAERYQDTIDMLEDAIEVVQKHTINGICGNPDSLEAELADIAVDAVTGVYSNAKSIYGIGSIAGKKEERKKKKEARKEKRQEKKEQRKERKEDRKEIRKTYKGKEQREKMAEWREANGTKTGKFLQKVARKVKQGMKAIARVLTAPQRLIMKGILEKQLPKAAPAFLYLFVSDPKLIEKLPPAAREKRKKAEKTAKFIIDGLGMKQNHFMGIVRNGIMKEMGDTPENIIAKQMAGKLSGIGLIEEAGKAAAGFLTKIIDWIVGLFKKKKKKNPDGTTSEDPGDPEKEKEGGEILNSITEMIPDPSNQEEQSDEVAAEIRTQDITYNDDNPADDNSGGKSIWSSFGGN